MFDAEKHLKLVDLIAKRFERIAYYRGVEHQDLVGAGYLGLLQACDKFEVNRGLEFSTYATPLILGTILRFLRDCSYQLKYPRSIKVAMNAIRKEGLQGSSEAEIANRFGCSIKQARKALYAASIDVHSLDYKNPSSKGESEITLQDIVPNESDYSKVFVDDFINSLNSREKQIVLLRMQGLTQAEIGKKIGLSQMGISRFLNKIKGSLEDYYMKGGEQFETVGTRVAVGS